MNSTQTDYTKLTTKELTIELKKEVEIKEENHQEFIKHH